jgi:splicing factor 3A subunit 1
MRVASWSAHTLSSRTGRSPALAQVHVPAGLAMLELDLIRLTAQYVARNGKGFLTGLMSRESSNPQFGFLKPTHSLFSFFTAMADAYSKVGEMTL